MITFKIEDFLNLLAEDQLANKLTVEGMVDLDEEGKHLKFSVNGSCEDWLIIPNEMIDGVDHIRMVGCKDHQHPYVRLYLKEPPKDNLIAIVYLQLLKDAQLSLAAANQSLRIQGLIAREGPEQEICRNPYIGPCFQQEDGSYKRFRKSASTGCEPLLEPCAPPPPPPPLPPVKILSAAITSSSLCTPNGIPQNQVQIFYQINGSNFVPGARVVVNAFLAGTNKRRGGETLIADGNGRISFDCLGVDKGNPGGDFFTFIATDGLDGGVGVA